MFWRKPFSGAYTSVYEYQGFNFSECGPSALAMIVNKSKGYKMVTPADCRKLYPTPSWWYAKHIELAAHYYGVRLTPRNSVSLDRHAGIYLSTYWNFGHWVIAWKEGSTVKVLDPKRGYYSTTERNFKSRLKSNVWLISTVYF